MKPKNNFSSDEALYQQLLKELAPKAEEYDRLLASRKTMLRPLRWRILCRYTAACIVIVICGGWMAWHLTHRPAEAPHAITHTLIQQNPSPTPRLENDKRETSASDHVASHQIAKPTLTSPALTCPSLTTEAETTSSTIAAETASASDSIYYQQMKQVDEQLQNTLFELQLIETTLNYALTINNTYSL